MHPDRSSPSRSRSVPEARLSGGDRVTCTCLSIRQCAREREKEAVETERETECQRERREESTSKLRVSYRVYESR